MSEKEQILLGLQNKIDYLYSFEKECKEKIEKSNFEILKTKRRIKELKGLIEQIKS